jgi:hypothetical protein
LQHGAGDEFFWENIGADGGADFIFCFNTNMEIPMSIKKTIINAVAVAAVTAGALVLAGCGNKPTKGEQNAVKLPDSTAVERESEDDKDKEIVGPIEKLREMGCVPDNNPYGFSYSEVIKSDVYYSCPGETPDDEGPDFFLKVHSGTSSAYTLTDTLIKLIKSHDKNAKRCCSEEDKDELDVLVKICFLKTDSIYLEYREVVEEGRKISPDEFRIRSPNMPISFGDVKIGMSWKEFLNLPELRKRCPHIKYLESEYIGFELIDRDVFFYFEKEILREMIMYNTHW